MIKTKTIRLVGLFIGALLIAYFLGQCSTKNERLQIRDNLIASRDSLNHSLVTIEGLANTVVEKDAIILTKEEAIKTHILENERLKALHIKDLVTNTDLKGQIRIKDSLLSLPQGTTIITVKDTSGITNDYVKVPFTLIDQKSTYLSLQAGMDKNRAPWFALETPFSGEVSVAYVKSGFLKTTPKGIFTSTNPYISINSMDVLIVQDKKRFFQKTWFHMITGIILFETGRHLIK